MKRLQIYIEEELDAALERQARIEGRSKASLIRQFVGERMKALPPLSIDPLSKMVGAADFDPEPVDAVVYR
jgi:hypothetical protein